jgi:hypothetical protein
MERRRPAPAPPSAARSRRRVAIASPGRGGEPAITKRRGAASRVVAPTASASPAKGVKSGWRNDGSIFQHGSHRFVRHWNRERK